MPRPAPVIGTAPQVEGSPWLLPEPTAPPEPPVVESGDPIDKPPTEPTAASADTPAPDPTPDGGTP